MRQNRTLDKPRLLGLVWPFIVVVLLQAMLAGGSLYVLSAVRSYVGGESLWSKGQKDAIYYLTLYADSRADEDFRRYEEAIAIPLGDREMRLALDQPDPDIEAARQGILKGGNHADDVTAIIWLYRNFHDFSYFERAIELWLVGDKYVMELIDVAGKMRAGIGTGAVIKPIHGGTARRGGKTCQYHKAEKSNDGNCLHGRASCFSSMRQTGVAGRSVSDQHLLHPPTRM